MSIYSANLSGVSADQHARIGKISAALGMYVDHESDVLAKDGTYVDLLYAKRNANSAQYAISSRNELGTLSVTEEGDKANNGRIKELRSLIITPWQFMKTFNVTQTMIEDSNFDEMKTGSQDLVRAYYRTRNRLANLGFIGGLSGNADFGGKNISCVTPDGVSLFNVAHLYTEDNLTQSNRFSDVRGSGVNCDSAYIEAALSVLSSKGRMLKDENGDPTGFFFDTIIVPAGNGKLCANIRKACGSPFVAGTDHNDINVKYGLWNVVELPYWTTTKDEFILMSSEANEQLGGNLFIDRIPFGVEAQNYGNSATIELTGRCRMGIGFGNYKHILHFESLANGSSTLTDGGTAGTNSTDVDI